MRELLALRNRSLPSEVQKHLLRLQQENLKLKELAQSADLVERLKLENRLMRLELQKMRENSDNANTIRSTDLSVRDNISCGSTKIARKSDQTFSKDPFEDFQEHDAVTESRQSLA